MSVVLISKATDAEIEEAERILRNGDASASRISKAFTDAMKRLGDSIDVSRILDLLRQGRVADAIAAIDTAAILAGMAPVAEAATISVITAGRAAAQAIRVAGVEFTFGITAPTTINALQRNDFSLIRELSASTREGVAETIRAGVEAGRNPLDVARDVRRQIGLTARQARAVSNYRRLLEESRGEALERALRDKRFDATVARSIADKKPLPKAKIDAMVARYEAKHLKYRSETIARTEGLRAANAGNHLAWEQAVAEGKLEGKTIVRKWMHSGDHKVRDAHRKIPAMNPEGRGLNEPFQSPLGPIMMPGDPNAPASLTVNCRCTCVIRFKWMRAAKEAA